MYGIFVKGQEIVEEYEISSPSGQGLYGQTDMIQNGVAFSPSGLNWGHFTNDGDFIRIDTENDPAFSADLHQEIAEDF